MSTLNQTSRVAILLALLGKKGADVLQALSAAGHPPEFLDDALARYAWTTEKPTQQGYYCYRMNERDDSPVIVWVAPKMDYVGPWPDGSSSRLGKEPGEWAGPLEPPV